MDTFARDLRNGIGGTRWRLLGDEGVRRREGLRMTLEVQEAGRKKRDTGWNQEELQKKGEGVT